MYHAQAANEEALRRATEPDNVQVWDGSSPGHYEVWYLTFSHLASRTGYWIRYTLEAPENGHGAPYAQLWFACFFADAPDRNFALNQRLPISAMHAQAHPFEIRVGDCVLRHDGARGSIEGKGHRASWDLSWLPAPETHRHLPDIIYRTRFADTRVLSPNVDVPVRGTVTVDGETFTFDGDPGGQTHLWGRKHAHAWAWGHCNAFEGQRGTALETLTVRLKRKGLVLPPLTILTLYLDGEPLKFTGFRDTLFCRGSFGTARYQFAARAPRTRIEGEFVCRPEDMVLTPYSDPDGEPSWCANTEVADLRIKVWRRSNLWSRWHQQADLVARKTGHFEVAGREPDPAITNRHVTVDSPPLA